MKILVTGATGFVGRTLIPYLIEKGWSDVSILVRNVAKACKLFGNITNLNIIEMREGWQDRVTKLNPDAVIHMATCFSGKSDYDTATEIINSNILLTTHLLESLKNTDCKYFINTGSFSEFQYGAGKFKPNNLYSASKTAVRPIIQYYQSIINFKWINVVVYSPYGRYNPQKKVIDYLIDAVDSPKSIAFSGGEQILDFIHVDDIASFYSTLLYELSELNADKYEFHLGTGGGISIREAAKTIEMVYGKTINADWGKLPYRENDIMHAVAPISTNLSFLNWQSRISFDEGIRILKEDLEDKKNQAWLAKM